LGCFKNNQDEKTQTHQKFYHLTAEVKQQRANEIMAIQSQISWENNQQMIGKTLRCLIDRKEGNYYIGRSEYDSPDVDNEIRIDAKSHYLRIGDFTDVTIEQAEDFDLYASPTELYPAKS
jgi:ribosomal protein S12 methylthiotransferase